MVFNVWDGLLFTHDTLLQHYIHVVQQTSTLAHDSNVMQTHRASTEDNVDKILCCGFLTWCRYGGCTTNALPTLRKAQNFPVNASPNTLKCVQFSGSLVHLLSHNQIQSCEILKHSVFGQLLNFFHIPPING